MDAGVGVLQAELIPLRMELAGVRLRICARVSNLESGEA